MTVIYLFTLLFLITHTHTEWDGPYKIISSTNKCLDINGGLQHRNGGKVQIWSCHDGSNQKWYYNRKTNNLRVGAEDGKCLDIDGPHYRQQRNGAKVHTWSCHNGKNQKFRISRGHIKSLNGKCLDVDDSQKFTNGGRVQFWSCNRDKNQQWTLQHTGPRRIDDGEFGGFDQVLRYLTKKQNGRDLYADCMLYGVYSVYQCAHMMGAPMRMNPMMSGMNRAMNRGIYGVNRMINGVYGRVNAINGGMNGMMGGLMRNNNIPKIKVGYSDFEEGSKQKKKKKSEKHKNKSEKNSKKKSKKSNKKSKTPKKSKKQLKKLNKKSKKSKKKSKKRKVK